MKKKYIVRVFISCFLTLFVLVAVSSYIIGIADDISDIPTVFVNDRPYGKYNIYPSVYYRDEFYVPLDIFTEFSQLSITQEANGGFLIENVHTGSFISYSGSNQNGVIANNRRFSITVLKRNNTNYIPAVFSCSIFSLSFETFTYKEEKMTRIKDSNATLTFPSLVNVYVPSEIPLPPSPPSVDVSFESNIAITFESFGGEYVEEILDICFDNDIKATFFFTAGEANANSDIVRKVVAYGHQIGIYIDASSEMGIDDIDMLIYNSIQSFRSGVMLRPHLVRFSKNLSISLRMSGDIDSLKKKYALSESAANLDSRDHIYSPSAVMEKLKAEMINSDVSIIRFTASSSTANAISMLISYIDESDLFSLFTINEASKYVFNEVF